MAAGASYPPLTLTVAVARSAPSSVTNAVTVSGGGERNTANDSAADTTTILPNPSGSPPTVLGTTPSLTSGTLPTGATMLDVDFSDMMLGADVAASYQLQSVGPDGLLGTADDTIVPLRVVSSTGMQTTLGFAGLGEGVYRLTVRDAITDLAGNKLDGNNDGVAGGDWSCDFVVVTQPSFGFAPATAYACSPTSRTRW